VAVLRLTNLLAGQILAQTPAASSGCGFPLFQQRINRLRFIRLKAVHVQRPAQDSSCR
jgi:hypothetical protein